MNTYLMRKGSQKLAETVEYQVLSSVLASISCIKIRAFKCAK